MAARVKYPRTFHLPWSKGQTSDDKTLSSAEVTRMFKGRRVIVTEKMDGENTTIYGNGGSHARSLDSAHHPSRDYIRKTAARLRGELPEDFRVCGENCFARHSIAYTNLEDFFLAFSVWEDETALSWDETVEWCALLDLKMVPVLWDGIWDEEAIKGLFPFQSRFGDVAEGYVARLADRFSRRDFRSSVAKFVRANHVQTSDHWMHSQITPNQLGKETP